MLFPKRSGGDVACADGGFDAGIVGGIADADGEIAGVKFDVLAAGNVFDGHIAGGDAGVKLGITRDVDFDIEVIARAAANVKFSVAARAGEAIAQVVDVVLVFAGDVHGELSVFCAEDANIASANMQRDASSGRNLCFKVGDAALGNIGFVGACGRWERDQGQRAEGREERVENGTIHETPR